MSILKRFYTLDLITDWGRRTSRLMQEVACIAIYGSVLFCIMEKQTISFRLEFDKVAALDALADSMKRDRTYLLGEAVQAYLETQRWHLEQIEAGIAEADAGQTIDHRKVKAMAFKWRRQRQEPKK